MAYERIVHNLAAAQIGKAKFNDKEYLTLPTVMITEGVHAGTMGPLLYLNEEFGKGPGVWDMKPAVIDHPVMNGRGVSACNVSVLEKQQVGFLMNTGSDGRLKTETWCDEDKLKKASPSAYNRIKNGQPVECSTGLHCDIEQTAGEWKGKKYVGIVRNIRPDHLAILPNSVGACSIADGGGLLRNASDGSLSASDVREQAGSLIRDYLKSSADEGAYVPYCYVCDVFPKYLVYEAEGKYWKVAYSVKEGKVKLSSDAPEQVYHTTSYVVANAAVAPAPASPEVAARVSAALEGTGRTDPVVDTDHRYVIFGQPGKLFRLPYTVDNDSIRFSGDPEPVIRVNDYRGETPTPTAPAPPRAAEVLMPPTQNNAPAIDSKVARKTAIDGLVQQGRVTEADRTHLESLSEATFSIFTQSPTQSPPAPAQVLAPPPVQAPPATPAVIPSAAQALAPLANQQAVQVVTQPQEVMTAEQYISNAALPPEIREVLTNGMETLKQKRGDLVAKIVANKANRFTQQYLETLATPVLEGMAALVTNQQPSSHSNYSGQAAVPMFLPGSQVQNEDEGEQQPLGLPAMQFGKSAAKAG